MDNTGAVRAFEVIINGRRARAVLLRELSVGDMILAGRSMPTIKDVPKNMTSAAIVGADVIREALRYSVVKVGTVETDDEGVDHITWTKELNTTNLVGNLWKKVFPRSRETFALIRAFSRFHLPDDAEVADSIKSMRFVENEDDTLLDTVEVTATFEGAQVECLFQELDVDDVGKIMRTGGNERSPIAGDFMQTIESLKRSLRSIAGKPVDLSGCTHRNWPLSVNDTYYLGRIWSAIHIGDDALGEMRAVSTN